VAELAARGVMFAPVTLHCGVSSLETGERPYPERYRAPAQNAWLRHSPRDLVPAQTAWLVNSVRWRGGRVIAVGTTVVRALETVAAPDGVVAADSGVANPTVTPARGPRAPDG